MGAITGCATTMPAQLPEGFGVGPQEQVRQRSAEPEEYVKEKVKVLDRMK